MSDQRNGDGTWSGERIKGLRKSLNVSQAGLAGTLDVTIRTVSRWETGKVYPTSKIIRRLEALEERGHARTGLPLPSGQPTITELIRSISEKIRALKQLARKSQ